MSDMVKSFTVLVVEDNEYYNILITRSLNNICSRIEEKYKCSINILSYTDPGESISKIRSGEFKRAGIIAFIDYYTGDGINGEQIAKLIRKTCSDSFIILLSQSAEASKIDKCSSDFFILKDPHAPALCCLYLEQFIDNKFS